MEHIVTSKTIAVERVVLGQLSPMEARCAASQQPLEPGDDVLVIYRNIVAPDGSILLDVPYIIKIDQYEAFVERFLDILGHSIGPSQEPPTPESSPT